MQLGLCGISACSGWKGMGAVWGCLGGGEQGCACGAGLGACCCPILWGAEVPCGIWQEDAAQTACQPQTSCQLLAGRRYARGAGCGQRECGGTARVP